MYTKFDVQCLIGRVHLVYVAANGRIILKWIIKWSW